MLSTRPNAIKLEPREGTTSHLGGFKTPGRALKGRTALQENVGHHVSMTVNGKGKKAIQHTPFRPGTLQPERLFKDASGPPLKSIGSATSRPLADKTPFPNRQNSITLVTPRPGGGKIAKLPLIALDEAQQHTPLLPPSSTRKKQRVPRSASKSFETPVTRGDHWNVSDLSIEVGGSSLEEVHEDGPDYSEPEYMPPTAIILPYQPEFELPDYKEVGASLRKLAHSYPVEEEVSNHEYAVDPDEILRGGGWVSPSLGEKLVLPELEDDDPFAAQRKVRSAALLKPVPVPLKGTSRLASSRTAPRMGVIAHNTSRTPTPGASFHPPLASRPTSRLQPSRPPTSTSTASTRRPLTSASKTTTITSTLAPARRPVSALPPSRAPSTATTGSLSSLHPVTMAPPVPVRRPASTTSSSRPPVKPTLAAHTRIDGVSGTTSNLRSAPKKIDDDIVLKFVLDVSGVDGGDDFRFEI